MYECANLLSPCPDVGQVDDLREWVDPEVHDLDGVVLVGDLHEEAEGGPAHLEELEVLLRLLLQELGLEKMEMEVWQDGLALRGSGID